MNIKDFFDLPEAQRDLLVQMHRKQKEIRQTKENIDNERRKLQTREINNQMECEHPFSESTYKAHENEFGNYTGGGEYRHRCDDCGKNWSTEK